MIDPLIQKLRVRPLARTPYLNDLVDQAASTLEHLYQDRDILRDLVRDLADHIRDQDKLLLVLEANLEANVAHGQADELVKQAEAQLARVGYDNKPPAKPVPAQDWVPGTPVRVDRPTNSYLHGRVATVWDYPNTADKNLKMVPILLGGAIYRIFQDDLVRLEPELKTANYPYAGEGI